MKRLVACLVILILSVALALGLTSVSAKPGPIPQSAACPAAQIVNHAVVVNNTCVQTLDIRVATPKNAADSTLSAGATWQTSLAVDSTNRYKFWSCPELLYPIDTATGSEATYSSTKVRCQSKP